MTDISVTGEKREGGEHFKGFNPADYTRKNISMFFGEEKKVTVEIENGIVGVFIDRFGKDITFRPVSAERSELSVNVNVSRQFFGWIFSLGKDVQVVGPEAVVEEMREAAREFLEGLEYEK